MAERRKKLGMHAGYDIDGKPIKVGGLRDTKHPAPKSGPRVYTQSAGPAGYKPRTRTASATPSAGLGGKVTQSAGPARSKPMTKVNAGKKSGSDRPAGPGISRNPTKQKSGSGKVVVGKGQSRAADSTSGLGGKNRDQARALQRAAEERKKLAEAKKGGNDSSAARAARGNARLAIEIAREARRGIAYNEYGYRKDLRGYPRKQGYR